MYDNTYCTHSVYGYTYGKLSLRGCNYCMYDYTYCTHSMYGWYGYTYCTHCMYDYTYCTHSVYDYTYGKLSLPGCIHTACMTTLIVLTAFLERLNREFGVAAHSLFQFLPREKIEHGLGQNLQQAPPHGIDLRTGGGWGRHY